MKMCSDQSTQNEKIEQKIHDYISSIESTIKIQETKRQEERIAVEKTLEEVFKRKEKKRKRR